jgi:hypothetical protein
VRALVLVPLPEGVPWQTAMMVALRGQAATWGGAANLVVPWTSDLLERPELWAIARALDPDVVCVARAKGPDLLGTVREDDPLLGVRNVLGPINKAESEAVLSEFGRRLPVLQRNGQPRVLFSGGNGLSFPGVSVDAIGGELGPARGLRCSKDIDLGLMLAAEAGDVTEAMVETLARRRAVVDSDDLAPAAARERVFRGPLQPGANGVWSLSETGLRWLFPVSDAPVTVSVVVGDSPWDFALGYALRRMTGLAWWLPTSVVSAPFTVPSLLLRVDVIGSHAERAVVLSVSDRSAATRLAAEFSTSSSDAREWTAPADLLSDLEQPAARLLTRAPGLETLALEDGATGFLPPELPAIGEAFREHIYWMAEVIGRNWQPLPDSRLSAEIVRLAGYDGQHARPTRAGVAYLCPHFMRSSDDLEGEVVRPAIAVLDLHDQLAAVLATKGWRLEPSDKGQYAEGAARLFGGDDELAAALAAPSWWGALSALGAHAQPAGTPRGWKLTDQRTYYALDEIEVIRAETKLETELAELLERRILNRGLVFRCPICRLKGWYGSDELAERLRCARCREPFALTDRGWQPAAEPQWRYRLNELLWQLLMNHGDIPLRAVRETLGVGTAEIASPAASLHEQDLWAPQDDTPIELDICAQIGPQLWIGEAKLANSLGTAREARAKLARLRQAAEIIRPHGILLVTASDTWTDRTRELAGKAFRGLPAELRFASSRRPE